MQNNDTNIRIKGKIHCLRIHDSFYVENVLQYFILDITSDNEESVNITVRSERCKAVRTFSKLNFARILKGISQRSDLDHRAACEDPFSIYNNGIYKILQCGDFIRYSGNGKLVLYDVISILSGGNIFLDNGLNSLTTSINNLKADMNSVSLGGFCVEHISIDSLGRKVLASKKQYTGDNYE